MKPEHINPFIHSVGEFFSTMLDTDVERGELSLTDMSSDTSYDIVAVIGMSGSVRGTVALLFPRDTALAIVNTLTGEDTQEINDTTMDGVAEAVNIVAGSAKAKLCDRSAEVVDLSLPTVLRGTQHIVGDPLDTAWFQVPFTSDLGSFLLRVNIKTKDNLSTS